MKKFKALSKHDVESYIIDCNDYLSFIEQLSKKRKLITRISPTFVAGMMSDRFYVEVRSRIS